MTSVEPNKMPWTWAFLLAGFALLVHTPVLHRQPLLDDWWVVPRVVDHGAPEPWPRTGDGSAIALGARATGEAVPPPYMSRPALWAAWRAVVHVGGAIDSVTLHALAWLAHAVSTLLVARLFGAFASRCAAITAAFLFATGAHGRQAVSWIAAGGDGLGTTCVLAACVAAVALSDTSTRRWLVPMRVAAIAAFASAALLFKESAVALFPMIFVAACLRGWNPRRLATVSVALVAAIVIAAVSRSGDGRVTGIAWPSVDALFNTTWNLGQLLLQASAPFLPSGATSGSIAVSQTLLRVVGVALLGAPLVLGWIVGDAATRRRVVVGVALAVVGLMPAVWVVLVHATDVRTNFFGRLTYAPWIGVLASVAAGLTALEARARGAAVALGVGLSVFGVGALVAVDAHEAHVDRRVGARLAAVASATPEESPVVVVDPHAFDDGMPLLGFGVEDAFFGAWGEGKRSVVWAPDFESLSRSSVYRMVRTPLTILDFTRSDAPQVSIVTRATALPTLGWQPVTDLLARDPAGVIAPRPLVGVTLRGRALGKAVVTTWFTDAGVFNVSVPTLPGHGEWFVDVPEESGWWMSAGVDQVRVEGLAPGAEWAWRVAPPKTEVDVVAADAGSSPPILEARVPSGTTRVVARWRFLVVDGASRAWVASWVELPATPVVAGSETDVVRIAPSWTDRVGFAGATEGMTWREAVGLLRGKERRGPPVLQYEVKVIPVRDGRLGEPSAWRLGHLRLTSP